MNTYVVTIMPIGFLFVVEAKSEGEAFVKMTMEEQPLEKCFFNEESLKSFLIKNGFSYTTPSKKITGVYLIK